MQHGKIVAWLDGPVVFVCVLAEKSLRLFFFVCVNYVESDILHIRQTPLDSAPQPICACQAVLCERVSVRMPVCLYAHLLFACVLADFTGRSFVTTVCTLRHLAVTSTKYSQWATDPTLTALHAADPLTHRTRRWREHPIETQRSHQGICVCNRVYCVAKTVRLCEL